MTSRNQVENVDEPRATPRDDDATKGVERSESTRELTDEELAGVVGGLNPQPLPPKEDRS